MGIKPPVKFLWNEERPRDWKHVLGIFWDDDIFQANPSSVRFMREPNAGGLILATDFRISERLFDPKTWKIVERGRQEDGNRRQVIQFHESPDFYFGVTIHLSGGTWSSWPPHAFEVEALAAPTPLYPDFYEEFALFTRPAGGWGIFCTSRNHEVLAFRDATILRVPLGGHPVVAGPGYRLIYFWVYTGAPAKDYG